MKMEMPIPSPKRGRVKEVFVKEGETVDTGAKLVTLAPL
jgi:biotin carboxyl carrier protein